MTRLLHEIDWGQPLLPLPDDPAWAAEVRKAYGRDQPSFMYVARSPWLRQSLLRFTQLRFRHISEKLQWLAILVTSQENACRFCYGAARAYLKMLGLSEAELDRVERDVKLAGADERERAVLRFCRNLSRSSPRPARSEFEALVALGFTPLAVVDIAMAVAAACFNNRVSTFLAVPLDGAAEDLPTGVLFRLTAPFRKLLARRSNGHVPPATSPQPPGPFSEITALVAGTGGAVALGESLREAFASPVLPVRTKAWVFAVVARALACPICEAGAARVLESQGIPADVRERVLGSLSGPELDETEAVLLPWVRETAHYSTEVMQRKTHELRARLGDDMVLDAIGLAALANSCARLSMLAQ